MNNDKIVLRKYGVVRSIRNEKGTEAEGFFPVESGVRTAVMIINKNISSYLRLDGYISLVTYQYQIRTCLFCDEPRHVRAECPKRPYNRMSEIRRPAVPLMQLEKEMQEADRFTPLGTVSRSGRSEGGSNYIKEIEHIVVIPSTSE